MQIELHLTGFAIVLNIATSVPNGLVRRLGAGFESIVVYAVPTSHGVSDQSYSSTNIGQNYYFASNNPSYSPSSGDSSHFSPSSVPSYSSPSSIGQNYYSPSDSPSYSSPSSDGTNYSSPSSDQGYSLPAAIRLIVLTVQQPFVGTQVIRLNSGIIGTESKHTSR
jgi:hypothetical protein